MSQDDIKIDFKGEGGSEVFSISPAGKMFVQGKETKDGKKIYDAISQYAYYWLNENLRTKENHKLLEETLQGIITDREYWRREAKELKRKLTSAVFRAEYSAKRMNDTYTERRRLRLKTTLRNQIIINILKQFESVGMEEIKISRKTRSQLTGKEQFRVKNYPVLDLVGYALEDPKKKKKGSVIIWSSGRPADIYDLSDGEDVTFYARCMSVAFPDSWFFVEKVEE